LERLRNRSRFGRAPDDPDARLLAGIVFTNGRRPSDRDIAALREAGIFAFLTDDEIYPVASDIHDLLVKTHLADKAKIEIIQQVVAEHFDVDRLLDRIDATVWPEGDSDPHAEAEAAGVGPTALLRRGWRRLAAGASRPPRPSGPSRGPEDRR
jgi:hypothetical protein